MLDKVIADAVKKTIIDELNKIYIRVSLFGVEVISVKFLIKELQSSKETEVKLFVEKS